MTITNTTDAKLAEAAEAVALPKNWKKAGFDVLLDDRDERAGVKFKDADLIGSALSHQCGQEGRGRQSRSW